MNFFYSFQEPIVYAFQQLAPGAVRYIWGAFSFIANPAIFLLIFLILYWNVSKKEGISLGYNMILTLVIINTIKSIFASPRPFQISDRINSLDMDQTATGTSFPSGHSAISASLFSSLYLSFKSLVGLILLIIAPIFVALSRVVLGVHFPIDVIFGLLIGYLLTFLLYRLYIKIDNFLKTNMWLSISISFVLFIIGLILSISTMTGSISHEKVSDLIKMLSMFSGFIIGRYLEERNVRFINRARRAKKILRTILGLIPVLIPFILLSSAPEIISSSILYFYISLWCTYIFPQIGIKTNLFNIV